MMVLAEQAWHVAVAVATSHQPTSSSQPSQQPTASEAPALPASEYQVTKKPGTAKEPPWGSPQHAPYVPSFFIQILILETLTAE
jgi:hypothetical protein